MATLTGTYPPQVFTTPNVVGLIVFGRYEEAVAAVAIPVGGVCMMAGGQVQPHNVVGGRCERLVARERQMIGLSYPNPVGVWDNYVAGDLVSMWVLVPGDETLGLLANGQNLPADTWLMSAGDGTLTEWVPGQGQRLNENTATSTVITNTTAETAFSTTSYAVTANTLTAGSVLHIRGQGTVVGVNGADTQTIKLKIGTTVIATIPATNYTAGEEFVVEAYLSINVVGASGSWTAQGTYQIGNNAPVAFNVTATAVDTTASQTLTITATASAANAGDQIELNYFVVDLEHVGTFTPVALLLDATNNSAGTTGQPYSPAAQARVRWL